MAISDIPILSMLRTRLDWGQERQRMLAQNVANADTPNYRGRDLKPPKFNEPNQAAVAQVPGVTLARTEQTHLVGKAMPRTSFAGSSANYEVRPNGTAVNLEEEMMKVASNQMEYQTATALYTRSLNLLKTAVGKRGA
ncbi:MAG: flagellar basal body rod protein FlgB [Pseudolabrys sp.]